METLENGYPPPPLASGKEGWRQIFWKQNLPPGYQPRPPSPPIDASRLIPGELWGASKEEIRQWRIQMGMDPMDHDDDPIATTVITADPNPPLTWGSNMYSSNGPQRSFQRFGQVSWKDDDNVEVEKEEEQGGGEEPEVDSTLFRTSPIKGTLPKSGWFAGAPIVPTSVSESPKSALNALYGKVMTTTPITEACYFYWDNGGPPHARRFTCVIACPATYEIFPAGKYRSTATTAAHAEVGMWMEEETGLVWYSRKKEAAQGAAAFRYDCWYYREWLKNNPLAPKCHLLGKDIPYASPKEERPQKVLAAIPMDVMELIEIKIAKWKEEAQQRAIDDELEAMAEMEHTAYRTAYMEVRSAGNTTNNNHHHHDGLDDSSLEEGRYHNHDFDGLDDSSQEEGGHEIEEEDLVEHEEVDDHGSVAEIEDDDDEGEIPSPR